MILIGDSDDQLWSLVWSTDLEPFEEGDHSVRWKSQRTAINKYCDLLDDWGSHNIADRVERCSAHADVYSCEDHGDVHLDPCLCRQDRVCPVCASRTIQERAQKAAMRSVYELSQEGGSPYLACWELTVPPHLWKRFFRHWKRFLELGKKWIKLNYTDSRRYSLVLHYWPSATPNSGEHYPHLHLVVVGNGRYKQTLEELDDMKRSWGELIGWIGSDEDGNEILPVCEYHWIPIPQIGSYLSDDLDGIPIHVDVEYMIEHNRIPDSVQCDLGSTVQRCFHRYRYMFRSFIWDLQPFFMEPDQVDGDVIPLIEGPGGKGSNYVRWGQGWKTNLADYEVESESLLDPLDNPRYFCQIQDQSLHIGGIRLKRCGKSLHLEEGIHIDLYQDRGPPLIGNPHLVPTIHGQSEAEYVN